MDPRRFVTSSVGVARKTPGAFGYYAFFPEPMPRTLRLQQRTVSLLSEADAALGRLAGAGRLLPNPHILVNPYIVREAVASSSIEGTQASISDVFDSQASGEIRGDVAEVRNCILALNRGLELLPSLPVSLRLVKEIHKTLLEGVRGQERTPGEFRRTPNWIGSPSGVINDALYVPPPPDEMQIALGDWERFANAKLAMPPLIRCALLHYQFETIHPFLDGNGRLGRLLIVFFLVEQGRLPAPLLYISSFFEQHRQDYYNALQAVRERGRYQEWLQFFIRAVEVQAKDALDRAEKLADLRERYRSDLSSKTRSRAPLVVEELFETPVVTARSISTRLGVSIPGAKKLINFLEAEKILREVPSQPSATKRWFADEILDVISA
jgi:Fic family protein